ncbi:molybdopterin molybdotransferase MoeA [Utexia brackfieldae]|uniref:molybdopterin molybdotransferase MoeA n=1 Tax=Utexia brackfieldae TaxID=3074108 RepID=UPI00370D634A
MSAKFLTFEQAKNQILNELPPLSAMETVNLTRAMHRIAAKPIVSPLNVPGFNNSAMDGYAVRLSDLTKSTQLPVADKILAGATVLPYWPENSCLRIMTGAPVPPDADAVVMQEDIQILADHIQFTQPIKQRQNIRYIGEDITQNEMIVQSGQKLTIPILSTLATLGISEVDVYRPIKVALFSTGDELCSIGTPLSAGKIYDSNRFTLTLMLQQLGCEIIDLGIIPDCPEKIEQALKQAADQADVIITSGGVSVGDADYTKQVLSQIGHIDFWKIAMKPGKPFAFGHLNKAIFCGLPGNPVSTVVTFYQLVQPLILKLSGQTSAISNLLPFKVKALTNLKKKSGRLDFQRGELIIDAQGELGVISSGQQGSHITQSLSKANCFIILEQMREDVMAGEYVTVELFNSLMS